MARIAFTTFAVMKKPYGNPEVQGFESLLLPTLEEAVRSPGFIAHPVEDGAQDHLPIFDRQWDVWENSKCRASMQVGIPMRHTPAPAQFPFGKFGVCLFLCLQRGSPECAAKKT